MSSVNKAIVVGRVGQNPEVKTLNSGSIIARLSIATHKKYKDRNGQKQEKTQWHKIVVWNNTAQFVEQFVHKGATLYVEGEIETRSYEDSQGQKKYVTEINANSVQLISAGNSQNNEGPTFNSNEEIPF